MTRILEWTKLHSDVSESMFMNMYQILMHTLEVFGLPPAFVAASLGDIGVQQIAELESMVGV